MTRSCPPLRVAPCPKHVVASRSRCAIATLGPAPRSCTTPCVIFSRPWIHSQISSFCSSYSGRACVKRLSKSNVIPFHALRTYNRRCGNPRKATRRNEVSCVNQKDPNRICQENGEYSEGCRDNHFVVPHNLIPLAAPVCR